MFFTWHSNRRTNLLINQHSCVICDHLVISSDPLDDFRSSFTQRYDAEGTHICCAENATQFETLLNVMYERKSRIDRTNNPSFSAQKSEEIDVFLPVRPPALPTLLPPAPDAPNTRAAHLFLQRPGVEAKSLRPLNGWDDSDDTAFVRKGIEFDRSRGRIQINSKGTYFVYSHLMFKGPIVDKDSHLDNAYLMLFQQQIKRQNPGHHAGFEQTSLEQVLLEDKQVQRCNSDMQSMACYTSKLYGQVNLSQGDEIFIRVRNGHLLSAGKGSFMGIYKIE